MKPNQSLSFLTLGIGVCAAAYLLYRRFGPMPRMTSHVAENLPVAKNLKTIADTEGNYDLDGVSFDTEGVVVSGDHH